MRPVTDTERTLLTGPSMEVAAGLDLLDSGNRFVADISDDLLGGSISRDNYAAVHGAARLQILRELAWGRDRVRPWMTVTDGIDSARFNLGVFVMTTPELKRGEEPATFDVQGYDLLHLLQDGPGDTYVTTSGTTYLQAARDVVAASGIGTTVQMDGTLGNTPLPKSMVWALDESGGASWLTIINDLLAAINYVGVWADEDGVLRSGPFAPVESRPTDWVLDTSDDSTNIVGDDRTLKMDVWGAPNWWKFVRSRMDTRPVVGDGVYLPAVNANPAQPESTRVGRIVRKVVFLDAADRSVLEAQGDRIVAEDLAVARTFDLAVDPLPCMGHRDVFRLRDAGTDDKVEAASWDLNLDGSPGSLRLGGNPDTASSARESRVIEVGS